MGRAFWAWIIVWWGKFAGLILNGCLRRRVSGVSSGGNQKATERLATNCLRTTRRRLNRWTTNRWTTNRRATNRRWVRGLYFEQYSRRIMLDASPIGPDIGIYFNPPSVEPADTIPAQFFIQPEGEETGCPPDIQCFDIGFGTEGGEEGESDTGNTDAGEADDGGQDRGGGESGELETSGGDDGRTESGCWPFNEDPDCFDFGGSDGNEISGLDGNDTAGDETTGNSDEGTEGVETSGCFPMNEDPDCMDLGGVEGGETSGTSDAGTSDAGTTDGDAEMNSYGGGGGTEPPCIPFDPIWDCYEVAGSEAVGSDDAGESGPGADDGLDTEGSDTFGGDTAGTDTQGADTEGADTQGADTEGADTEGADTQGVDIEGADVQGAETAGENTAGLDTAGSDIVGMDTAGTNTSGAENSDADSDTDGSNISGVDISGIDISGIDTSGADTEGISDSGDDTSGIDVAGVDTFGADISGIDISGGDLVGADISGDEISGLDTAGDEVSGLDTAGNETAGAETSGSEVSSTDDSGTDNFGADNSGTDMSGADVYGTDGTETDGAETDGAETDGAETDGAETDGAETDGADTNGADTDGTGTDGAETGVGTGGPCEDIEVNHSPIANHDPPQDSDPATPMPDAEFLVGHTDQLEIPAPGVLINDTDPESCQELVAILVSEPSHGKLVLNPNGSFAYDPDDDFVGHDTFRYRASDGELTSNIATVFLLVTNEPPVAVDDYYFAMYETVLTVDKVDGVLANDSDPEGDALKAKKETDPQHGSVTLNPDGSFTYSPHNRFAGSDSFTYRAGDGVGWSEPATVSIQVRRPEPDVDTDSDNNGTVDRTAEEDAIELAAPGNILRLNIDDDNQNCTADASDAPFVDGDGNPMIDDELEPVVLDLYAAGMELEGFVLTLSTSGGISVWATADKQKLTKTTFVIGTDEIPNRVFVEGWRSGAAQIHWTLFTSQNVLIARDTVKFSVIALRIDAFRPQTEGPGYGRPFQRSKVPDAQKGQVGIRRNGDDDDSNAIRDGLQLGPVAEENDTIEIEIWNSFTTADGIEIVLRRSSSNINVWEGRDRSGPIIFGNVDEGVVSSPTAWIDWYDANPDAASATLQVEVRDSVSGNTAFVGDAITLVPFKSVVIVLDGEFQNIADPATPGVGIIEFAVAEYRNSGYDIHAYEESDYLSFDIRQGPAWREIVNAINNRGVTEVAIMGYSHGAGDTYLLAEALATGAGILYPFIVPMTGYIDAIQQPFVIPFPELRRPPLSQFHVNQYQTTDIVTGGPSNGDDDLNRDTLGVSHTTIDDHADVLYLLQQRLYQRVSR